MKTFRKCPSLDIVVPCYNETEAFPFCLAELRNIINRLKNRELISSQSGILFVDDGSKDDTWRLISESCQGHDNVKGIKLSRNKGHQVALIAGLGKSEADIVVSIDADLQDDTNAIEDMVVKYHEGFDVVYGVRNNRQSDTFLKKNTALLFYKLMSFMGVNQIQNHADFRLLSRVALNALLDYREENIYIRGLIPMLGFPSTQVFYSRSSRVAGESKYPLKKMLSLAVEGITSLTITPLRMIAVFGLFIAALSTLAGIYAITEKLLGRTVDGWASVMIGVFFLGGVQMLSLGVIGEYIGKIYVETKRRPKFFISEEKGYNDVK
ncbi:glycosyltransferase family 2 protein [Sodalis sp. RH20]|uniref:glycosyltransferase family 2 protein n=1 Tax=unclassified Sodalis (in: enterobacteria) TaxID=2636512 RepID=UPI0039B60EB0